MIKKIINKFWSKIRAFSRHKGFYHFLYKSKWHSLFYGPLDNDIPQYLTSIPNHGAGIGHQMANWIAGYAFAKKINLGFLNSPFPDTRWEEFLGFGRNELQLQDLKAQGYKKRLLPLFDEKETNEVNQILQIIASYKGRKIYFQTEQDQFLENQYEVIDDLRYKFYSAPSRSTDKVIFDSSKNNIAIHIRRGDILALETIKQNIRFQDNMYFEKALKFGLQVVDNHKETDIYVFSQGKEEDFSEFKKYKNIKFCFEMSAMDSFLHMVMADVLITSKSSFSYKPALLNRGIKIVPSGFWHGYPEISDWIVL